MARRGWISPFIALRHQPWSPSSALAPRLNPSELIEEEKTPYYRPERFYPVELGQVFQGRYQIATKLGYGSGSTVWLARDLQRWRWQSERYVAIKVTARSDKLIRAGDGQELSILRKISETNPRHDGWHFVRKLVDYFCVDGVDGGNACLVFEPLSEPLWLYSRRFVGGVIPPHILKIILRMILLGLDYLHTQCEVIHTDLKPDNIMVKMEDPSIFERDARDELLHPLPQKHADGRIIYLSRNNYGKLTAPTGVIQIADFDLAVLGNVPRSGCIQADIYRAPEVILDAGYSYSADIWSLGVMLWDLLEGVKLFNVVDTSKSYDYDEHLHLASITALLGPVPSELHIGRRASSFYKPDGSLREPPPSFSPEPFTFQTVIGSMTGPEKELFIRFAKRMICWDPTQRSTAKELFGDPWLHTDFSETPT